MNPTVSEILWLEEIVEKLARKHQVEPHEVEQVLASARRVRRLERGHVQDEDLYTSLGRTDAGRYLIVFFVLKADHRALIVSARDMTANERKTYGRS
jgi:uncharacterized protein